MSKKDKVTIRVLIGVFVLFNAVLLSSTLFDGYLQRYPSKMFVDGSDRMQDVMTVEGEYLSFHEASFCPRLLVMKSHSGDLFFFGIREAGLWNVSPQPGKKMAVNFVREEAACYTLRAIQVWIDGALAFKETDQAGVNGFNEIKSDDFGIRHSFRALYISVNAVFILAIAFLLIREKQVDEQNDELSI